MQEQIDLEVSAREERGKNANRRLRAGGSAPAILYGFEEDPCVLSVNTKTMTKILASTTDRNRVLNLSGGAKGSAMASDWQIDPVTSRLLHVDLRRVDLAKKVRVKVPFKTTGVPFGVKNEAGFEDIVMRQAEIECLPLEAPESIVLDVSELHLGQAIRLSDIDVGDNATLLGLPNSVVVHVVGRKAEEEEVAEDAEAVEGAEGEAAGDDAPEDS